MMDDGVAVAMLAKEYYKVLSACILTLYSVQNRDPKALRPSGDQWESARINFHPPLTIDLH
jgi:hypothetical protein